MTQKPARYQTRPQIVDAMQWDGSEASATELADWCKSSDGPTITYNPHLMDGRYIAHPDPFLWVDSMTGRRTVLTGDWLVRKDAEFVVFKSDQFAERFEPAFFDEGHHVLGGSE